MFTQNLMVFVAIVIEQSRNTGLFCGLDGCFTQNRVVFEDEKVRLHSDWTIGMNMPLRSKAHETLRTGQVELRLLQRQDDSEGAAAPNFAFEFDAPTHQFYQLFGN